ncbi:MAG: adenylate/guanylate cyclase domain-containing protein [Chloroflexota bacterium]|nr:MAG: adenylate/guanylate cyclase domain-containing protein [Chloroflexota bacterium]
MADKLNFDSNMIEEVWRVYLTTGSPPDTIPMPWYRSRRLRSVYRHLPAEPRCRLCYYPFEGMGGLIVRHLFNTEPSKMNPQICNFCEEFVKEHGGGAEVEVSILFADVRGSTSLAEKMNPTQYSQLIRRFNDAVTKALFASGALVEKLIGDAVTGFFTTGIAGPDHARVAVQAARTIMKATGHHLPSGPWIPVGIGIHTGIAYVGSTLSTAGAADITVFGDTANTGARLASLAGPGEIFASQATAAAAGLDPADTDIQWLNLKGRDTPVEVWKL